MTSNSQPLRDPGVGQYSERVIHGEIYKARPDVNSVCHHHCPAFMPLLATGTDYMPIFHLGAVGGIRPPFWDQRDEFGDTNMLVIKPEEGASLARALGKHWMVLMMRHGVTVAGTSVRDCVFRSVFSARNAEYQVRAMTIGSDIATLSPGETQLGRPDQREDHRPDALVGILVDARRQQGRAVLQPPPELPNRRATRPNRRRAKGSTEASRQAAALKLGFPVGWVRC